MKGLIQKSGYIKPGSGGGHYAEYIATRDGVEVMEPAAGGYLEYMAQRPRSHCLFSADVPADLEQTMEEISAHAGPVWTFIYSLKREDAARLGYENGESWRRLLLAHQTELAAAMKIPPGSFRWRAAFHDEKHHPHIHMMAWSADPKQGYLTEKGIEQMRSQLSNDIFQDELLSLCQEKDLSYQQVRDAAMEAMGRLIREMKSGLCDSPVIAGQMETLAEMLSEVKGKKVYGYLKKPVKAQVDAIVDKLARLPEVAECYDHWNRLRDELERYYKDTPREHKPFSQQPEFKAIKNMVIREAEELRLGAFTFEDIGRFLAPVEYYTVYKAPRLLRSQQINILGSHALGPSERRYAADPLSYLLPCQLTRAGPGACLIGQRYQQIPAGKVGRQRAGQPIP